MKALLGTKIGMTQIIGEDGVTIPVTIIQAGPVTVTQVKSVETDGYNAVQVAFDKGKNLSKAVAGHVKPAKVTPKYIREFRVEKLPEGIKVGDTLNVSSFELGETVHVTGTSKGKGCLLYTSPSPRDRQKSRMPSSAAQQPVSYTHLTLPTKA